MKKHMICLVASLFVHIACAANHAESNSKIKLYDKPRASHASLSLPASSHLVPIFRQGDWIKVGDRANGQTGWVNIKQYRAARSAYVRPDVQTIFIENTQSKSGKPTINIVAYKNGKKLTDKAARTLYHKMAQQQRQQQRYWYRFNHMMQRQERDMDRLLNDNFMDMRPPLVLEPGPVMPASSKKASSK